MSTQISYGYARRRSIAENGPADINITREAPLPAPSGSPKNISGAKKAGSKRLVAPGDDGADTASISSQGSGRKMSSRLAKMGVVGDTSPAASDAAWEQPEFVKQNDDDDSPRKVPQLKRTLSPSPQPETRTAKDFRTKWINDLSDHGLKNDAFKTMEQALPNSEYVIDDMFDFPKWGNGKAKLLRESCIKRLLLDKDERTALSNLPGGDISAAQGDVNHLKFAQLLKIRRAEADFKNKADTHAAHRAFMEKLEKNIIKVFVDVIYQHKDKPELPPQKDSVSEAVMMTFASAHDLKFKDGPTSNWWATCVGDFKLLYVNVSDMTFTFTRPAGVFNIYRDYSKQIGSATKLYTVQIVECPADVSDDDVLSMLKGSQANAESILTGVSMSELFQQQSLKAMPTFEIDGNKIKETEKPAEPPKPKPAPPKPKPKPSPPKNNKIAAMAAKLDGGEAPSGCWFPADKERKKSVTPEK